MRLIESQALNRITAIFESHENRHWVLSYGRDDIRCSDVSPRIAVPPWSISSIRWNVSPTSTGLAVVRICTLKVP